MPQKYFFGTRHFYLAEEWVRNGHQVTIFTSNWNHLTDKLPQFDGSVMIESINDVETVWFKGFKTKCSSSVGRILSWIEFEWRMLLEGTRRSQIEQPDVVIVSSLSLFSVLSGLFFSRKHGARFLLEIRDIWPLTAMQLGGYSPRHPFMLLMGWIEKLGYKNADAIIGTMPNLEEHIRNVCPDAAKVVNVPQGVTRNFLNEFNPMDAGLKEKLFPENSPMFRVVYAGGMNVGNPVQVLLDAAVLLGENSGVEVVMLGKGSDVNRLKAKYQEYPNIKFVDQIPKNQVRDFLQHCDLCFDSIGGDIARYGHSRNKWMDYLASARPIVCATSGFRSILEEAECGEHIDFDDVAKLAHTILKYKEMDPSTRLEIGLNGRRYLEKNRTFDKLAAVYETLFAETHQQSNPH